ncbi:MAG: hypothetical protein KDI06_02285 [Calditrichaeota bacterium]|nr:hypothetical protein [Calditrichota bacterium]
MPHRHLKLFILLGWALIFNLSAQTTYTWFGGTGNWNSSGNWSPNGIPGSADLAQITVGTVIVDSDVTVDSVSLAGGILQRDNKLTVLTGLTWTGGDVTGTDTLDIQPGAMLHFSGNVIKDIFNGVIINRGFTLWDGTGGGDNGRINFRNEAIFINASGALFEVTGNALLDYVQLDQGGFFRNFGTLTKSGGVGETNIDPTFYNTGTVNVESGWIRFERGDSTNNSTGTFNVDSGTFIELSERLFNFDGATITGAGEVRLLDADLILNGTGLTIPSTGNLAITNVLSSVTGSGPLTNNGNIFWQNGVIQGSGSFTNNQTITLQTTNTKFLNARDLNNQGTVSWEAGQFQLAGGVTVTNGASGTISITNGTTLAPADAQGGDLVNNGTIVKAASATGGSTFNVPFTNNGTVRVSAQSLAIIEASTSNSPAAYKTASGATTTFSNALHTVNGATFDSTGTAFFSSDTLLVTGSGMTINSPATFQLTAGRVLGKGNIQVDGTLTWLNAQLEDSGTVDINGTMNVTSNTFLRNFAWTITNNGTVNWNSSADMQLYENATFVNNPGGVFNINQSVFFDSRVPDGGNFINKGTLTRTGSGETVFDVTLTNIGTIQVNQGNLDIQITVPAGLKGTVNVASGATAELSTNSHVLDSLTVTGSGGFLDINNVAVNVASQGMNIASGGGVDLRGSSGSLVVGGPVDVDGTFDFRRGTISGSGAFQVDGSLLLSTVDLKTLNGKSVTLNGTATWTGGIFRLTNNATLAIGSTGIFDVQTDNTVDDLSGSNVITNAGIFRKTAGSGTSTIEPDITNTGTISAEAATMAFVGAVDHQDGAVFQGSATLNMSSASLTLNGDVNPGTSAGQLSLTGNYAPTANSALNVEIGGTTAGSNHDQLAVSGNGSLNGTLNISFINSYVPSVGDSFTIATFGGSRSGTFATVSGPTEGGNPVFTVTYLSDRIVLGVQDAPTTLAANVKVFLEAPYSTGSMSNRLNSALPASQPYSGSPWNYAGAETVGSFASDIVDWVLLELRTGTGSGTLVGRRAALLKSDGTIVDTSGSGQVAFGLSPGDYYVVVYHRNHVPVMTSAVATLGPGSSLYDFTTAQTQAFGSTPMVDLGSGVFGLAGGDADSDGDVDSDDKTAVAGDLNNTGYRSADINFSQLTTYADKILVVQNTGKTSQVPAGAADAPVAPQEHFSAVRGN